MLFIQCHGLFNFPAFPDTAAGIVGRAEDGSVDLIFYDLALHIFKVHPPDALFIQLEGAVDDMVAVVGQGSGEADVSGGVDQNLVTPGAQYIYGAGDTAQNTVGIADMFRLQAVHTVALASIPVAGSIISNP